MVVSGFFEQDRQRIADFGEVVRGNIGGHAHRDTRRSIDQQVGNLGRQHQRLVLRTVVVGTEVDRLLFDVRQHLVGDLGHADFGVTHGRRVVAVNRAEVALSVDQGIAQGEILRHAHDGVVHRRVAVRVVFADDIAHDTGRFLVCLVPVVAQFAHREQHPAVHRLQAVAHVRQGPSHDHAHRIIEIGAAHFFFQADRKRFLGELFHRGKQQTKRP